MRISSQPISNLTTAPLKDPSLPNATTGFSNILAVASGIERKAEVATSTAPERGNDKKNEKAKSTDASHVASVSQPIDIQTAALVAPVVLQLSAPVTFTPGLSALVDEGSFSSSSSTTVNGLASLAATAGSNIAAVGIADTTLPGITVEAQSGGGNDAGIVPKAANAPDLEDPTTPYDVTVAEAMPGKGVSTSSVANVGSTDVTPSSILRAAIPSLSKATLQVLPRGNHSALPTNSTTPTTLHEATPVTSYGQIDADSLPSVASSIVPVPPHADVIPTDASAPGTQNVDTGPTIYSMSKDSLVNMTQNLTETVPFTNVSALQTSSLPAAVGVVTELPVAGSLVKTSFSAMTAKDGISKQSAVSSKDRSLASEAKAKRKVDESSFEDADTDSSTSFYAKPGVTPPQGQQKGNEEQTRQPTDGAGAIVQQPSQNTASIVIPGGSTPQTDAAASSTFASTVPQPTTILNNTIPAALPSVNSAQLVQSIHQSDMRLGMHSVDFGAISINTSLSHQMLSAQISTEHAELGRALALHLPSIEEKLGSAYGVHAKVEIRDDNAGSYGGSSQQSQSQQTKDSRQGQGAALSASLMPVVGQIAMNSNLPAAVIHSDTRLDIRI